ncbi:MAG: hypothetical protein MN733_05345, partial [Nitrososphaera sp.]|nr:hypothetical protein [Nitrososphaera sp.]
MPTSYTELLESFPPDLRLPMARLVDVLKEELQVTRSDFTELRIVVRELAEAQKRTELRVEELAEAQKRTELRVEELAEAQKRPEQELQDLKQVVRELAEAQKRT